jgi:hypothetical protein
MNGVATSKEKGFPPRDLRPKKPDLSIVSQTQDGKIRLLEQGVQIRPNSDLRKAPRWVPVLSPEKPRGYNRMSGTDS